MADTTPILPTKTRRNRGDDKSLVAADVRGLYSERAGKPWDRPLDVMLDGSAITGHRNDKEEESLTRSVGLRHHTGLPIGSSIIESVYGRWSG